MVSAWCYDDTMISTVATDPGHLSRVLDAERDAILWCAAAEFAVPEVKAAREAHLAEIRAELVTLGLTR